MRATTKRASGRTEARRRAIRGVVGITTLVGATLAAATLTTPAAAQIDIDRPLPNLMLLIDTSGSMSYMPDGSNPLCVDDQPSDLNRWGTLIEVLTGSINNRGCFAQDRTSNAFKNEFTYNGEEPYDADDFIPYYRYLSNGCTATPGIIPVDPYDWSAEPIAYRPWNQPTGSCAADLFSQGNDGLLDVYRDRIRFGLFTFDSHPSRATGVSGNAADTGAMAGLWSYYPDWWTGAGTPASGHPPDCAFSEFEVGARNAAAPAWEGRMVSFGPTGAPISDVRFRNERIQEGIIAMRPYGATPIAGMMADAAYFFRNDTSTDQSADTANASFAPPTDPLFIGGCRESYILLLSDGEPNLDLRPYCEQASANANGDDGECPYSAAHEYAYNLANPAGSDPAVRTFVVGFGLSTGANFDCNNINVPADLQPGGVCETATGGLRACCNLTRIAYEGGTDKAFFADDPASLQAALAAVFDSIASETTSRTLPVFVGATATTAGVNGAPEAVGYEFNSAFSPQPGELWVGSLQRKRWICDEQNGALVPTLLDVNEDGNNGDDFADNVLELPQRRVLTVVAETQNSLIQSRRSIRPELQNDDGMGQIDGTTIDGSSSDVASAMASSPKAMELDPMPATCSSPELNASSPSDCANKVMTWELGDDPGTGHQRSHRLGAIYHSTPALHDAPRAFVRDPAYEVYAEAQSTRPMVLYTATVDGQLHAFKVVPNDANDPNKVSGENNEIWSFIPPFVLPSLITQYPGTPQILLDGRPVVKDVVFQRDLTDAQDGNSPWRSVLVAGGYLGGGFYYALDVTDPYDPKFLWQLSSDRGGNPLFSGVSGTPAIATVAMKDGNDVVETAVAILPGGEGRRIPNCTNARNQAVSNHIDGPYQPRASVGCWQDGPAQSLTIVRLSDGEVLRTFRRALGDGPASLDGALVTTGVFDSPITGTPVPFPGGTGQVSNRIYVGDSDGALWRIDMADPDPAQWEVHLAFDAYPLGSDTATDGQPIAAAPVLSVDGTGNTVILFSTGDQEDFTSTTVKTRAWSLTESLNAGAAVPFRIEPNWYLGGPDANNAFEAGEKVTGAMTIFDGVSYFSTFTPPDQNSPQAACQVGLGRVYGVDFVEPDTGTIGPQPEARLDDGNNNIVRSIDLGVNVTPFGVAVTAEPACTQEASVTDDFVGKHTTLAQSVPPTYKLRFQTGLGGDTEGDSNQVKVGEIQLPTPRSTSFIDSWASIIE